MGSIPIIAEGIQQPAPPNLLQNAAQAQAIHAGQQEQQLRAQQVEQGQIQLNDQKAMTSAMQSWDGKDFNELPSLVLKHGGSANAVIGLKQHIVDQQTKLAQLDKDQLATLAQRHDMQAGALNTLNDVPDAELGASLLRTVQNPQYGFSPQDAQQAFQIAQMDPKSARSHLSLLTKGLQGEKEQVENAKTAAEQQKNAAQATEATANTAKTEAETQFYKAQGLAPGVTPEMAGYAAYIKNGGKPENFKAWQAQQEAQATGPEKIKVANAEGAARLAQQKSLLDSQATQMAAQYFAQTGQMPAGMRSPGMSAAILNQAAGAPGSQAPDIAANKRTYAAQTALQKSATSGKIGANITAYNTAIAHAQQLQTAADALDNGNIHILNQVGNTLGYQFGSDKTTNFNVIKNALSGEISKVFKGGEATDAEIKAVQEPFSAANSPAQLKGAITNAIHLMNSKRDALKAQYDQGMQGQPNFGGTPGAGGTQSSDPFAAFGGKARAQ